MISDEFCQDNCACAASPGVGKRLHTDLTKQTGNQGSARTTVELLAESQNGLGWK